MEERPSDTLALGPAASHGDGERRIWQTPLLSVVEVEDVTLGIEAYYADGIDGS